MLELAQANHIYGFEGTTAKTIFVIGFGGLAVLALIFAKMSLRNWLLAAVLFITSICPALNPYTLDRFYPTWLLPLQMQRANIHLILGIILSLMAIGQGSVSVRLFSAQHVLVLLLAVYCGMLRFIHESAEDGFAAVGFAIATIPAVSITASLSARSYDGCVGLLKVMMWASVIWTFCASVQFVINPEYLVSAQGRFLGLLGNAQHVAAIMSVFGVVALWLFLNDKRLMPRLIWLGILAINILFIIWTGSRTGALMFCIGIGAVLYARIGKAVALLPVAGLLVWGLAFLAAELKIGANLERLVSTEDTRQNVWSTLWSSAAESPLIGVGFVDAGGSESSYLLAFAAYGIVALGLTLLLAFWTMWQCFRLFTQRRLLPREYRPLADLYIGFCAMYFAGAGFEGYIHARSFSPQILLLTFASIGLWLRQQVAENAAEQLPADEDPLPDAHPDLSLEHA